MKRGLPKVDTTGDVEGVNDKAKVVGRRMTTRSQSNKRRREEAGRGTEEEEKDGKVVVGLLSLPQDIRLGILKYLDEQIDLPEYACVSKTCREDRDHPNFGHVVKWAKLNIRGRTTVVQILKALDRSNQRGVFTTFTGLFIQYIDREERQKATIAQVRQLLKSIRLRTVKHLKLIAPPRDPERGIWTPGRVPNCIPSFLSKIIPNLQTVQLSLDARACPSNFVSNKNLESFQLRSPNIEIHCDGREFMKSQQRKRGSATFKRLILDGCTFEGVIGELTHPQSNLKFMHHIEETIEELSISNISGWFWDSRQGVTARIPQQPIMDFIIGASKHRLRWIRISHNVLSAERIETLKAECPDITFVVVDNDARTPVS